MTSKEVSELIRKRREELGYTVEYVGHEVGVSKSTVSRRETGDINEIKRSSLFYLSKVLCLPIEALFGDDDVEITPSDLINKQNQIIAKIKSLDTNQLDLLDKFIQGVILK